MGKKTQVHRPSAILKDQNALLPCTCTSYTGTCPCRPLTPCRIPQCNTIFRFVSLSGYARSSQLTAGQHGFMGDPFVGDPFVGDPFVAISSRHMCGALAWGGAVEAQFGRTRRAEERSPWSTQMDGERCDSLWDDVHVFFSCTINAPLPRPCRWLGARMFIYITRDLARVREPGRGRGRGPGRRTRTQPLQHSSPPAQKMTSR